MRKFTKADTFGNNWKEDWQISFDELKEIQRKISLFYGESPGEEEIEQVCMILIELKYASFKD